MTEYADVCTGTAGCVRQFAVAVLHMVNMAVRAQNAFSFKFHHLLHRQVRTKVTVAADVHKPKLLKVGFGCVNVALAVAAKKHQGKGLAVAVDRVKYVACAAVCIGQNKDSFHKTRSEIICFNKNIIVYGGDEINEQKYKFA